MILDIPEYSSSEIDAYSASNESPTVSFGTSFSSSVGGGVLTFIVLRTMVRSYDLTVMWELTNFVRSELTCSYSDKCFF